MEVLWHLSHSAVSDLLVYEAYATTVSGLKLLAYEALSYLLLLYSFITALLLLYLLHQAGRRA